MNKSILHVFLLFIPEQTQPNEVEIAAILLNILMAIFVKRIRMILKSHLFLTNSETQFEDDKQRVRLDSL